MRYVAAAGTVGAALKPDVTYQFEELLNLLRKALGNLGRAGIHSSRDLRAVVITLSMLLKSGSLDAHQLLAGLRLLLELAEEMRLDVDVNLPEMNTVREWEEWKELIEGLVGVAREAKPIEADVDNLLKRFDGACNKLLVAADAAGKVEPPKVKKIEEEVAAATKSHSAPSDPTAADDETKGRRPGIKPRSRLRSQDRPRTRRK
jgi:Holliday junction resolvase RusA-like endonuclease